MKESCLLCCFVGINSVMISFLTNPPLAIFKRIGVCRGVKMRLIENESALLPQLCMGSGVAKFLLKYPVA